MDRATLSAYDTAAPGYARRWLAQDDPAALYALLRQYFRAGLTADVGCGSGRDTAWLNANGFPAIGYDASEGLLAETRARYPQIEFRTAALPELDGIPRQHFDNVCCETVIMHLPQTDIAPAAQSMVALLKPGGILFLSWRVTTGADRRDDNGRLYSAFDAALVRNALSGAAILFDRQTGDLHQLVARAK
jgi:SAM-dependent methyltransferase